MTVDWSDLLLWLIAAAGLVVLSAFFSGTEVALFSLRRVDREQLARSASAVDARDPAAARRSRAA